MIKQTSWILALSLAMASSAHAQSGEVVQATPSAAAVDALNRNLALLSRNPQDVTALLGAAQAAMDLGDIQAANGFYTRANLVNPNHGKTKLGLAIVQIALKQAPEAAANFDAAEALGERADGHLAERGLAYDLTGQQAKAQRDYVAALRANPADENARLRYAVSLGISGRLAEAQDQLDEPLKAGDREAWRLRAFIYAMNGRMVEARQVTQSVMPKGLADALDPYMARVALLTPAQKAAAALYGEFPNNVLKLAAPEPTKDVQIASNEDSGKRDRRTRNSSSGSSSDRRTDTSSREGSTRTAPSRPASASRPLAEPAAPPPAATQLASNDAPVPTPAPRPAPSQPAPSSVSQPVRSSSGGPDSAQTSRSLEAPVTVARAATNGASTQGPADPQGTNATPTPPPSAVPAPGFSAAAQPVTPPTTIEPPSRSLADTLSALSIPEQERQRSTTADMTAVAQIQDQRRKASAAAAAKAKAEADAKAKAEAAKKAEAERKAKLAANPARIWVQIATGKDVDALAFDMRRMRRSYADALGDSAGWTAEWGATRRLLVGPFKKSDEAKAVVGKIAKSGGDAFIWQSDAGEEVTKIGGK